MFRLSHVCGFVLALGVLVSQITAELQAEVRSPIKSDEQVVFYPTLGWRKDAAPDAGWEVEIHGCIYEPGRRVDGQKFLQGLTGIDVEKLTPLELKIFGERAEPFAVDHERDKAIPVRIAGRFFTLSPSEPNGHFQQRISLSDAEVESATGGRFDKLSFMAVLPSDDQRMMEGVVDLMPRSPAMHVVSDLDDTIKISQVRDKPELLLNTFCRPFRPVPGMAALYRNWSADDVRFHYVSASPWQLYVPLANFMTENQFPAGSFHMKHFRLHDRTALNLLGPQETYKRSVIEPLLKQFPEDQFILVGDTGEQDPLIYARLARDYSQVSRILIRNVTHQTVEDYRSTFEGLSADRWQLFRDPAEIADR